MLNRLVEVPAASLTLKISPMPWYRFGATLALDRWKK